jgi:alanyl-tRNA synthetase
MSSVNDIRSGFLNYFAENGHQIVDSSPLVPQNDPDINVCQFWYGAVQKPVYWR